MTIKTLAFPILLIGCIISFHGTSQVMPEIPVGTWRTHLSYREIISLAMSAEHVYAATDMGILILDRNDNTLATLNKLSGLSSSGISAIEYDTERSQLIVAYEDGNLDFIRETEIVNFSRLKELNTLSNSRVNDITVRGDFAYFPTAYGIVVFDLEKDEVKETWRDLGAEGESVGIEQVIFFGDSIAAATSKGVMTANTGDNLLDFAKWNHHDNGDLGTLVTSIAFFNESLFAVVAGNGIYRRSGNIFVKTDILPEKDVIAIDASENNLIISAKDGVWLYDSSGVPEPITGEQIEAPGAVLEDPAGTFWIADHRNGLVSNVSGAFSSYLPNGPSFSKAFRLRFGDNRIFAVQGGYSTSRTPLNRNGAYDYFENGIWSTVDTGITDATDIIPHGNKRYISSFGMGIAVQDASGTEVIIDDTNSALANADPPSKSVYVPALAAGTSLWALNYGVENSLHSFSAGIDTPYPLTSFAARYPLHLTLDQSENVWMAIDPQRGGGIVVRRSSGEEIYLTDVPGSGDLPHRNVNVLTTDLSGNVWVGTDEGVGYFYSDSEDAIRPIFENRFLLKDEKITALAVDGGNRKWIGTQNGVWLFNPEGDALVHSFTAENSPLLSNEILDIAIHDKTGEVFFSTGKGIISYRSDASGSESTFSAIKIFPNPVTAGFTGLVGISGLASDAIVKITDVNGRLIAEVLSNGGTAAWNVRDYNGDRPGTGVYLVFASSPDGKESIVGKIALID